jgi:hypothetical protein
MADGEFDTRNPVRINRQIYLVLCMSYALKKYLWISGRAGFISICGNRDAAPLYFGKPCSNNLQEYRRRTLERERLDDGT